MEKKKAAAAAVASVIAASGVAVEASIDDPGEILQNNNVDPKVEYVTGDIDQDAATDMDTDEDKQKAKSAREAFGDWILGLPLGVRIFFVLPQWIIGSLVMAGGNLLFAALSPVLNWVLSFLLFALVIAAAFTVTAKLMFPDLPLRKILNKHSIKWILIVSVLAFAADVLLAMFWPHYTAYKFLVLAGLILISLLILTIWFSRREDRRRKKAAAAALEETEVEEPEELVYSSLGQTFTVKPGK